MEKLAIVLTAALQIYGIMILFIALWIIIGGIVFKKYIINSSKYKEKNLIQKVILANLYSPVIGQIIAIYYMIQDERV